MHPERPHTSIYACKWLAGLPVYYVKPIIQPAKLVHSQNITNHSYKDEHLLYIIMQVQLTTVFSKNFQYKK